MVANGLLKRFVAVMLLGFGVLLFAHIVDNSRATLRSGLHQPAAVASPK